MGLRAFLEYLPSPFVPARSMSGTFRLAGRVSPSFVRGPMLAHMRAPKLALLAALTPFSLGLTVGILGLTNPSLVRAGDDDTVQGADVKIEVRQENGKVVTYRGEYPEYEIPHVFKFKGQGHEHEVGLTVVKGDTAKTVSLTLGYDRDGVAIIAPFDVDWPTRKRELIWTDDEKFAVAITIKPKRIAKKNTQRDESDQIDPTTEDDPLGGLEIKTKKKKKKK